jgi:hypothetical protein
MERFFWQVRQPQITQMNTDFFTTPLGMPYGKRRKDTKDRGGLSAVIVLVFRDNREDNTSE